MIGYKKDNKGETVLTKRNAEVLQDIASIADGKYIDGNTTDTPVKFMANVIGNAQKSEFETKQFSDYKDQFQWFLAIGLFFLIIDIFLFEKKTKWLRKVDLFGEEKKNQH